MKNALVIAAREFEEKRFVAYAAVAFAILPFVFAAIPGIKSPADTIAMGALVFGTTFAIAVGVISGASFIGRDLTDGRMSFYFSRPVSALSIWFGKLTAAILMIVGTFGLILLPARLAAGDRWTRLVSTTTTWSVLYILVWAIALFLIAHVISTFARSRSPLIVFDFAAAVISGVAIRLMVLPLDAGGAIVILKWLTTSLAIAAVVGIVGGGAWQLERGRTDRRRNHLALSQFLWGTMAVALLIAAAYVAWVVSVKPSDLTTSHVRATRSTSGPFAVIAGTSRGRADYHAAFLLNTEDGSTTLLDPRAEWGVRYTRDGRSAVVPRASGNSAEMVIYTRGKSEPIITGLTADAGDYFVSDDGGRIATISHPNILSVYDVAQKRSLASVRLPDAKYVRAFFVTPDVLRLYLNVADGLKIVELDVRARGLQETGVIASSNFVSFYTDPTAARMLAKRSREDVLMLSDARTGASIRTVASGTQVKTARFLRDGRMVFVDGPGTAAVLHILTADGIPQGDVPLGPTGWVTFVGDDGMRVVLLAGTSATHGELISVNLDRRVVERREAIINWLPSGTVDPRPPIEPLHEVWYSDFSNWKNRILAWNPATGAKRLITGG